MRKLNRFQPRTLRFRLFLILAGALVLLAAFTPRANATLIRYYNFEGTATPPYPVNLNSNAPAVETGPTFQAQLFGTTPPAIYPSGITEVQPDIPMNVPSGAPVGTTSLGTVSNKSSDLNFTIPMPSAGGIYDVTSISFAFGRNGNGYTNVNIQISTDGGTSFTTLPGGAFTIGMNGVGSAGTVNLPVAPGTTINQPTLVLRLNFTGGFANGRDHQFQLDNVQINGTIVPEPATVAGSLLGVLGLCWHQRRRLIRSVSFQRT